MARPHPIVAWLAAERQERGLTQRKVGKLLGVAQNTVCHWESGETRPDIDRVDEWLQLFGQPSLADLMKDTLNQTRGE